MTRDMLVELFNAQHDLQVESFGINFQRMPTIERIDYIKNMKLALEAELQEALDETTWKPWTTAPSRVNVDAYVGELVDALHFLLNLFLVTGEDPTELARRVFTTYQLKNRVNARRQSEGYDGTNKCPRCRRALDDPGIECDPRPRGVGSNVHPETGDVQLITGAWCGAHGMYDPATPNSALNARGMPRDTVAP